MVARLRGAGEGSKVNRGRYGETEGGDRPSAGEGGREGGREGRKEGGKEGGREGGREEGGREGERKKGRKGVSERGGGIAVQHSISP